MKLETDKNNTAETLPLGPGAGTRCIALKVQAKKQAELMRLYGLGGHRCEFSITDVEPRMPTMDPASAKLLFLALQFAKPFAAQDVEVPAEILVRRLLDVQAGAFGRTAVRQ